MAQVGRRRSVKKLLKETAENRQNRGWGGTEGLVGGLWGCSRAVDHKSAIENQ